MHSVFLLCRLLVKSVPKNFFSYFSTETHVVGTQEKHLNETVLLSTQNMLKWIGM